jgi:prepilin-type N-terminal cleavage/methylation domain-containing protein
MLQQLQKRKESGFTIIEVLIVLAIAGLIMVVVFLAVPALQRSGRNNAMNTDANNVLTAVGNYSSNNGGTLPATLAATAPSSGAITIGASTTNQETAKVDTGVKTVQIDDGTTLITPASGTGVIQVVTGTKGTCNATGTGLGTAGSPRSYAVLFIAESGTGNILKCVGN